MPTIKKMAVIDGAEVEVLTLADIARETTYNIKTLRFYVNSEPDQEKRLHVIRDPAERRIYVTRPELDRWLARPERRGPEHEAPQTEGARGAGSK